MKDKKTSYNIYVGHKHTQKLL